MEAGLKVKTPVRKPLMVFDGECGFCRFWIRRWRKVTAEGVEYVPFQEVWQQFPEIHEFGGAVHLIEPDGAVYQGAEAVVRSLATNPRRRYWLWLYRKVPGAASLSEWAYRLVANHRAGFSALTRRVFGNGEKRKSERRK